MSDLFIGIRYCGLFQLSGMIGLRPGNTFEALCVVNTYVLNSLEQIDAWNFRNYRYLIPYYFFGIWW